MLQSALLRLLNYLLGGESWARQRLLPFSGQSLSIVCSPWRFNLSITSEGYFAVDDGAAAAAVSITLPADTPFLLVRDRQRIISQAQLSGPANFCETLAFVFRHLRWDSEADLAGVLGDIPGRRLHRFLAATIGWQREAASRVGANLGEYLSEETPILVSRPLLDRHHIRLEQLQNDLQDLEARMSKLAKSASS